MPYRALTHGRVNTPQQIKGATGKNDNNNFTVQQKAYNSQAGVANSGSNISQKNKLKMQTGKTRNICSTNNITKSPLIPQNNFGPENKFVPGQGKGFPTANPLTSVGSTNTFARRAIKRRAVTKTVTNTQTSVSVNNCDCE